MSATGTAPPGIARTARVMVWDPVVRYGHWGLVAAFAIAYLTGDDDDVSSLHIWTGYAIGAIVAMRVVWGFIGTPHARFSDFASGPGAALTYLKSMFSGTAKRYIGHSPAAGAMIVALLLCLSATVYTGVVAGKGEGARAQDDVHLTVISPAYAEESEGQSGEKSESRVGELHELFANLTLALVFLHILGVGLASLVHRENLVASMITGEKRGEAVND